MLLLHDDAASTGLLRSVGVVTLVDLKEESEMASAEGSVVGTHSAPAAGNHEILGLLVGEGDEAESKMSARVQLYWGSRANSLHGSLGNRDSSAVQVLLQSLVELIETAKLQFSHALLLASAGVVVTNLVRLRHCEGDNRGLERLVRLTSGR